MGLNWQEKVKISGRYLEYGSRGHYSVSARLAIVASQAAGSTLFELRNPDSRILVVPTRVNVRWIQTASHTAAIEDSVDLYKVTGFTALDAVNTVTPTFSVLRGTMAAPANAVAQVLQVTAAGAAAGMTGGTMTKDNTPLSQLPKWLYATQPTSGGVLDEADLMSGGEDEHPLILAQNEGIVLQNRVLLGAAAGSSVYIDVSWAEIETYA